MDEDSEWGSWGLDPAATRIHQQQQQQQSSTRSEILHPASSGKGTSNGAAAPHPTSSNGNVKSAPKKSTSRQSSITRLSTIMSQQSPSADTPADAHIQKLPLRQTSHSSQSSLSAADEWQSLLADTTAAPIKVQASKARPTLGPPKLQGAVSTHPSGATGRATSGPTLMSITASPASQSAQLPAAVSAGQTNAAGTTAAGDISRIATAGPKTGSRVAGKAADLPSDSQRAISLRSVSADATAKSGAEISRTTLVAEVAGHPAGTGPDVAPSISHKAAAKPLGVAPPTDAKGLPSGSRLARQRLGLFSASQALPNAMLGAAASKADQAAEAPPAMSGRAGTRSASSAASERYSKFMAGLPGRDQLPARGGLSERGMQPRVGRTAAAQTPKEGTSSSPSKGETSPLDASHSAVPGQGPPLSVKTADVSLPKAAGISSAPEGSRQATAAEAAPSTNTAAAPAALSAASTPANIPSAPSATAAAAASVSAAALVAAAAEPMTATGASASAGSSTAADSRTPASQTAATKPKLRPSSKSGDGAKPSQHADVRPTTSRRAAADAAASVSPAAAGSPAADVNIAPAKLGGSYHQQPLSTFSDSSLGADSMATPDMDAPIATTSMSTAIRDTTDAISSHSTRESTAAAAIPFATFGSSSQADDDANDFFAVAGEIPPTAPASRPPTSIAAAELPQHLSSTAAMNPLPTLSAPTDASSSLKQPQMQLEAVGPGKPNVGAVRQPQRAALPARHRGSADAAAPQLPFLQHPTAAAPPASVSEHHAQAPAASSAPSGGGPVPATGTAPAAAAATGKLSNKADVSLPPALVATDTSMPTAVVPAANLQAEAAFSAAGQASSYGGSEEPTFVSLDEEREADKAEQQSGFVPIPFGGSSSRPSFAAAAPFGSHMDLDSMDDSFFDSIGTGESVAVAPLADLQFRSGLHPTEPTPSPSNPQQPQAASELSMPSSAAASPVSHRDTGGAHMSQELPSFHDWGQTGNLPSASVSSVAVTSTTSTSHPQSQATDSAPQLPAQIPVQLQHQLPEAAEALSNVLRQQEGVQDELMALHSEAAQQAAVALDLPEDFGDTQQGDSPQRQAFSIPFSGQSDPSAEEEDDLFGAGPSHEAGPFGAPAPPSALPASEPSFTFDDVDLQSQQQQSGHPQDQHNVSSHGMLTQLNHQQQQHDRAMWPESQSQSQPQPPVPAESQHQPQYLFQPQPQSLNQSQSQVSAAYQSQGQPQLPFPSQPQAQSQGQSHSQAGLFRPARQSSHGHAQAQAPQLFMPQSSATQGIAYCQAPSIPSLPFQQQPGPAQTPWDSTHMQSQMLHPSLPLQLSVNTQRLSSPHAVDDGQQSQPDFYDQDALWPGLNQAAALDQQQGQSMWPGPNQVAAVEQPQQQGQSMWPHEAAFAEAAVESHAAAGASQQHDSWAGQHVPSQGFTPHLSPLLPSHGANPLNDPQGYSSGQVPAAPVASAAASSFPTTMSSPFAQAGYPSQSDPWAFEPEPSSSLPPAQPGYPPSSSAQPANPWAPVATYSGASPWDSGLAPAVLGGGQGSDYRSPDGRPAVSLMVFGFAGKMYCWHSATSTSSAGIAGGGNGFGGSSAGALQFLSWPKAATETTPAQQQQQQPTHLSQAFQESSMSATHGLLTHFPGPLMPNTHKDKVLKYVGEACDSCLEREPQCREPAELQLLWKVVQLLCQHKGDLHSALTPGVNDKRPEALLAAILAPAQTHPTAAASPPNDPWSGGSAGFRESAQGVSSEVLQPLPGFGDLQQAAGQMQQLLMSGHRLEALRVAVAGKLWGPALLLARHCSEKAFLETAAAMAEGSTTMGSPLHTLTLLMSGKADAVHAAPARPGPDSSPKQQAASVQYGSPFAQPAQPDADGVLSQWRGNLAIMAANRVAGEEAAMVKLGDRLWQERSQAVAGHICYVLAGLHVQPQGPASQLCLVGADHCTCPRRFATIPALQRSEVLEWARSQGNPSYTLQHGLMLLPYKFLYAAQLAEHGLISEAAQYCGAIQQALGAVPKLPPGLAVCRAFTQDLLERLQTYAAAHNIPLQMSRSGSVLSISGVGRWIDRGLSKLMGGPEQPPLSGPGSTGSTQSEMDPYVAKSKHRRNTSDQHLGSDTPKVIVPKRSQSSQDMGQLHLRSAKATPSLASTPEKDTDPSEGADNGQKASLQGAGQAQKAGGLGWGVMSRVASGLLGSGSKKGVPDKKVTEAKLGDENKFYYDNELKQWRVQGEEAPPPSGPPPPPPKMTPQRSASGSLAAGLTRAPSSGPPSSSGKPPLPGAGPPSSGPSSGGQPAGPRSAVRSRYVSNFSSASTSSLAATAIPLVPPRAFGAPRPGSQPAQLFQPSAPAASAAASGPSSSDRNSDTAPALPQSANDAVPPPPTAFGLPQGKSPPVVRGSSNGGGAPQVPFGSTAAVPRHNPYAQMAGIGTSAASAGVTLGAARRRPSSKQGLAPASQRQFSVSGTAEKPVAAQPGSLDQQPPQPFAPPQNDPSTSQDLVTTYSSFGHDPVDPYLAFGSGPAATYSASGYGLDPLDGSVQTSAVMTAYQDDSTEHGNNLGDRFDDMTELQL